MRKHCHCRGRCTCDRKIVHPTREEVKNIYTEETVDHIYPSHTTIVNNHTIRNVHSYPHSTSYETRVREIDVRNNDVRGISDTPNSPSNVAGARGDGDCSAHRGDQCRIEETNKCGRCCQSRCRCRGGRRGFWF